MLIAASIFALLFYGFFARSYHTRRHHRPR